MSEDEEYIKKEFLNINIRLSERQVKQFYDYYHYLISENKKVNLTNITKFSEVVLKHFIDSCVLVNYYNFNEINSFIDIGTGAGFPGIPLSILFPECNTVLLDSLKKRTDFLNDIIKKLDLRNTTILNERAEVLGHDENYREKFDLCVSRAVANLSTLSELCIPYIKVNKYFISYKTMSENEILNSKRSIELLGGEYDHLIEFTLPDTDIKRSFVFIKKITSTESKYPRRNGIPLKRPL